MAHFAKVVNGRVVDGLVAEPEFMENEFIDETPGEWIQTSYNTRGGVHYDPETGLPSDDQSKALRYNYASIGGHYDVDADAFYESQPFPSWTLDTTTYTWISPQGEYPQDGNAYEWNEVDQVWEQMTEPE